MRPGNHRQGRISLGIAGHLQVEFSRRFLLLIFSRPLANS
jgi:hypothetical protein